MLPAQIYQYVALWQLQTAKFKRQAANGGSLLNEKRQAKTLLQFQRDKTYLNILYFTVFSFRV